MAVFQVSSKTMEFTVPPKKKPRRLRQEWSTVIRFILAVTGAGGFFALLALLKGSNDTIFILLPVLVSLAATQFKRYNHKLPGFVLNTIFSTTPLYLIFTILLAFIYYGTITVIELLIHLGTVSHIILITTALTWAIMLEPLRAYFQLRIERRFNVRNRTTDKAIEEFTKTLREEIDLDQLCERFLTVIQQTLHPYSVFFWIRISHKQQEQSSSAEMSTVAEDDPLLSYLLDHPRSVEVDRLRLESPFLQKLKLHTAEILLPLASQGELIGLLVVGPDLRGEAYPSEDRAMLDMLAPQVAPALRVAQMVQERQRETREHERIEQELRTAQAIQQAFLPKNVPDLPGWHLLPYYQPAREVGGDFYDFLPFEDGQLGLVIGDVTGKGIPAALVMATVHTMLRSAVRGMTSPGKVLAQVNDQLAAEIPKGMFVTCFFILLDPVSGRLRYANAGQDLPYLRHAEQVSALRATGMPLGLLPGSFYEELEITVAPGECILFYSDGLVEAHNGSREMFGFPRLMSLVGEHPGRITLIDFLLCELATFTGANWEQEDDITLVVLQRAASTSQDEAKQESSLSEVGGR